MLPHEILDAMYESEINVRVDCFHDDGWIGLLGDDLNGFPFAKVRGKNFDECVRHLAAQACAVYPESDFANAYRGKF
jgi:hypothetical protein